MLNNNNYSALKLFLLCTLIGLSGCASVQTLSTSVRAGETVSLSLGWLPDIRRADVSVSIQPCVGSNINTDINFNDGSCLSNAGPAIVYPAGDDRIRGLANINPDPLSSMIYEQETGTEYVLGDTLEDFVTDNDKEYLQTIMLLDLPTDTEIFPGLATVSLNDVNGIGITAKPLIVEILPGQGSSNQFFLWDALTITNAQIRSFERVNYKTINFTGTVVPYALQIDLTHNPDAGAGGSGVAYVVNPRGDIKNVAWSDDGTSMRVILTPAWNKGIAPTVTETLGDLKHYRFHIAGDITGLLVTGVQGFDIDGNSIGGGLTANIE